MANCELCAGFYELFLCILISLIFCLVKTVIQCLLVLFRIKKVIKKNYLYLGGVLETCPDLVVTRAFSSSSLCSLSF